MSIFKSAVVFTFFVKIGLIIMFRAIYFYFEGLKEHIIFVKIVLYKVEKEGR